MKSFIKHLLFAIYLLCISPNLSAQSLRLQSPDGKISVVIEGNDTLRYSINYIGKKCLLPSSIGLFTSAGNTFGLGTKGKIIRRTVKNEIRPLYGISDVLQENYNEMEVSVNKNFRLIFRAYNEGVAYRFTSTIADSILVQNELAAFRFPANYPAYFHPRMSEAKYRLQRVTDTAQPNYSSLPILVKGEDNLSLLIHESDVLQYPCLAVKSGANNALIGIHEYYPKREEIGSYKNYSNAVRERETYICRTSGSRLFPWRMIAIAPDDKDILANSLPYLLAGERASGDWSWVKPGKVIWDWWNNVNITGVSFKAGVNTDTYKHLIDFAAENKIEYVNLDEYWSDPFNLLKPAKDVNMEELSAYAKQKGVGLFLWCVWHVLEKQMAEALDLFQKWGIAGIKVDFINRDDQKAVAFCERTLQEAAKRKLLVNLHGAYHPNGLERRYPNNINVEGVRGLEWNKFNEEGTPPDHDVTIPFIRMFAGGMDYTPGAMQNYNKQDWRMIFDRPMSQGTRCHQLAMYVIFYGPLQMLADATTAYNEDKSALQFLSAVPTTWDETVPIAGKVGEYIAVARRKGTVWYIGAMTNWTGRDLTIDLSFLPAGSYRSTSYSDGVNAERNGNDYRVATTKVTSNDKIILQMASGGGYVTVLEKE